MGDRPLSGVLPALSVTVMLGAGVRSCLDPGGARSELLDLDLDCEL